MQLIGMLDSPYVRRSAISLRLLGLDFEHRPVSVFRHFDEFHRINAAVKAPTLVCDDGTVLMDSNLILQHAEEIATIGRSLVPATAPAKLRDLRVLGLALAACEKGISIVYERNLRPVDKQHEPWVERVRSQLLAACADLEREIARGDLPMGSKVITQAGVTAAVTWSFLQLKIPGIVASQQHIAWSRFAAAAERIPEFTAFPQQ